MLDATWQQMLNAYAMCVAERSCKRHKKALLKSC